MLLLLCRFQVRYIDGDEEILNMRKEKWYFLNESKSSKDKEANQTGCDEEASTMPQKKKAKTRKEQSTNKQSKMLSPFPPNVKKDDEVIYREVLTILFSATNLFC
jgi:hypothetical protein